MKRPIFERSSSLLFLGALEHCGQESYPCNWTRRLTDALGKLVRLKLAD